jgi:hypothetical protein
MLCNRKRANDSVRSLKGGARMARLRYFDGTSFWLHGEIHLVEQSVSSNGTRGIPASFWCSPATREKSEVGNGCGLFLLLTYAASGNQRFGRLREVCFRGL